MNKPACFVTTIDLNLVDKLKEDLCNQGFEVSKPKFTKFQAKKKDISLTVYESGKLTVQGKDKEEFITYYLEPEILQSFAFSYPLSNQEMTPHIGVDEAGKGDYFGALCVAGVYASSQDIEKLHQMGVRDSKKMSDSVILSLSKQVRLAVQHKILCLMPLKYNELYERFTNLNHMLAWGHITVIEDLHQKTQCKNIWIDQFAHESVILNAKKQKNLDIDITQKHQGESDLVVAAASIIARAAFLDSLEKLSSEFHHNFPKGASAKTLEAARGFIEKNHKEKLKSVAKLHFQTTTQL